MVTVLDSRPRGPVCFLVLVRLVNMLVTVIVNVNDKEIKKKNCYIKKSGPSNPGGVHCLLHQYKYIIKMVSTCDVIYCMKFIVSCVLLCSVVK